MFQIDSGSKLVTEQFCFFTLSESGRLFSLFHNKRTNILRRLSAETEARATRYAQLATSDGQSRDVDVDWPKELVQ